MKFLLWGLVVFLVVTWLLGGKRKVPKADRPAASAPPPAVDAAEPMQACAQCGLYVPVSEAIVAPSGSTFCCEEHRRQHARV